MKFPFACALALAAAAGPMTARADDIDDLAKKTQNPIGDVISVPFQFNVNPNAGPFKRTQELLNIQPVAPISVAPDWNLIVRPIIPLLS